jgi:hypothetical protein
MICNTNPENTRGSRLSVWQAEAQPTTLRPETRISTSRSWSDRVAITRHQTTVTRRSTPPGIDDNGKTRLDGMLHCTPTPLQNQKYHLSCDPRLQPDGRVALVAKSNRPGDVVQACLPTTVPKWGEHHLASTTVGTFRTKVASSSIHYDKSTRLGSITVSACYRRPVRATTACRHSWRSRAQKSFLEEARQKDKILRTESNIAVLYSCVIRNWQLNRNFCTGELLRPNLKLCLAGG